MTKKLLLIRPKSPGVGEYPPYNLVRLASYFGGDTRICDLNRLNGIPAGLVTKDYDYVGFTVWGNMFQQVKQLCHSLKSSSDPKIIVGGSGVTATPAHAMKTIQYADTYVVGDGEDYMLNFNGEVGLPIVYSPRFNWKPDRIPRWELIDFEKYVKWPGLPVETSRGCPFNCVWCTAHLVSGKKWRPREYGEVVREIITLWKHFKCRTFYFPDDNAMVDPKRWRLLMKNIINCDLNSEFHVPEGVQAHHLDRDTLQLMKHAGFKHVTIGAESGVQRVLDNVIGKGGLKVEQSENVVRLCHTLGLTVSCFFVIGTPGETLDEMKATVDFAEKLRGMGAYSCMVRNAIPVPGTRMFREAVSKGHLTVPAESMFDMDYIHRPDHFMITDEWTPQQVMKLVATAKRQDAKHILTHKKHHVVKQGIRRLIRDPRGAARRVRQLLREAST